MATASCAAFPVCRRRIGTFSPGKRLRRTWLPHCCPAFVEHQALDIVGEVGERDLRLGARDADGADEQPSSAFSNDASPRRNLLG